MSAIRQAQYENMKASIFVILIVAFAFVLGLGGWAIERKINWLWYGKEVDAKIELLKARVIELEKIHEIDLQSE